MDTTRIKIFSFIVFFFLALVNVSYADTFQLVSSTNFSRGAYWGITEGAASFWDNYLSMGTGITGIPYSLATIVDDQNVGSGCPLPRSFNVAIVESTTNATSTYTGNYVRFDFQVTSAAKTGYVSVSTASTTYGGSWDLNTSLDSTKYYGLVVSQQTSQCVFFYGNNASGSWLVYDAGHGFGTSGNGKVGLYFDLNLVTERLDQVVSSVSNLSPSTGQTTASTSVPFTFTYTARSDVAGYVLSLVDLTSAHAFPLLSGPVLPDSTGSITRTVNLTTGHGYRWNVFLVDSSQQQVPMSTWQEQYFSVVSGFASTSVVQNFFTSTSTLYDSSGNLVLPHATSSLGSVPSALAACHVLGGTCAALCTNFPFAYLCDFGHVIDELSQSASVDGLTIALPGLFGHAASSGVNVINTSSLASNGAVAQIKYVLELSLWLVAAAVWTRLIFKVI